MAGTKNPTGMTAARSGMKITYTWKIADEDYDGGQEIRWRTNRMKANVWNTVWIGTQTTSYTVTLNAGDYYPYKAGSFLRYVALEVRGKRKSTTQDGRTTNYDWSKWVKKDWIPTTPRQPRLSSELHESQDNVCIFTWDTDTSPENAPFANCEYQSILVKESKVTDGSKLKWNSSQLGWFTGVTGADGSLTVNNDSVLLAENSYTRWFRIRSRGCSAYKGHDGVSYWSYAKHVFAMPYCPVITKVEKRGTSVTWVYMMWTLDQNAAHPVDEVTVQWAIDTPNASRACPSGATWNTARTFRDTGGADAAQFVVDDAVGLDECLWVRVTSQHDRQWRATGPKLVYSGKLTDPTNLTVETNDTTHRATVTVTNNSDVPDSRIAIIYREKGKSDIVVGVIPHGSTTATVQCPDWTGKTVSFGVYAFQGSATGKTGKDGVTTYAMKSNMFSNNLWQGGSIPMEPTNVTAEMTDTAGEVLVAWNWSWTSANRAEISWSKNPNAWESTEEPDSYMISNLNTAQWRVSGLSTGVKWYFRVRLAQVTGDEITYGSYCDTIEVDLSSAPSVPTLTLTNAVVTEGSTFTASWAYSTTDGTGQSYAEICEATVNGSTITYGSVIASTTTEQHTEISAENWNVGTTHFLCVRVTSGSGRQSDWSDPVPVTVAEPISCVISATSLESVTITNAQGESRTVTALTEMPFTATVTGAGEGGVTTLIIERAQEYRMIRPDNSVLDGNDGETIVLYRQNGEAEIEIDSTDLIGRLDDGAPYRLIAMVEDGYGQTDTDTVEFEVHWEHQAEIPSATVEMENGAAVITPIAPDGAATGDVCDIYRLSIDAPELIVENGTWGTKYVDPYPAIGQSGGHRVVHRTANGDYITAENQPAWVDLGEDDGDILDIDYAIIDFDGQQLQVRYNMQLSGTWAKDFLETKYLGGSVQGDWNPATSRTATIEAVTISDDLETVSMLRALAVYDGICHVRTPDGSSYAADVQIGNSMEHSTAGKVLSFTMTITRVDPEEPEGIAYSDWVPE